MGYFNRLGARLATTFSRRTITDSRLPPIVDIPGSTLQLGAGTPVNDSPQINKVARGLEAMLGLVSPSAGPVGSRWSSYPATDLTPAKIVDALRQADQGYPLKWAEMVEQVLERDGDLSGMALVRRQDVAGKPFRIVRRRGNPTPLADSMKNLLEAVVFDIDSYDDAIEQLLAANGQGWGSGEIAWDFRRVKWKAPDGRDVGPVTLLVPRVVEWVHPKHFRSETYTDEPLLVLGSDNITLPYGKFIFHRGEGQGYWERRGFMRSCIWYSAAKSWSFADWITFIHRFGIPTPYIQYTGNEAQYEEFKALYEDMLNNLGKGIGAILPKSAAIDTLKTPEGGRGSDPHGAMVDVCNASMAVRILGGTLTTRAGNSGSYALGDVHATVQHARELADARKFSAVAKRDLHEPFFFYNRYTIADAIGEDPDDILDAVPEMRFRIAKETSPQERAGIITAAINEWGLVVDEEQLHDEFDLDMPRPGSKPAPGRPQQVSKGGGLVGSVEASREGAVAPPDDADAGTAAPGGKAAPTAPAGGHPAPGGAPGAPVPATAKPGAAGATPTPPPARTSAEMLRNADESRAKPPSPEGRELVEQLRQFAASMNTRAPRK